MFNIGDTVLYGSQGVCKLEEEIQKDIDGQKKSYYVLKPVYQDNSTIFVPTKNETLTGRMHKVLSCDEIKELVHSMPETESAWIEDDNLRRTKYRSVISSGDRCAMMQIIKALYAESCRRKDIGKKLHQNDEVLLHRAETLLYEELALVLNIKPEQVVPFISNQIEIESLK